MIREPEQRKKMGMAARKRLEEEYTLDVMLGRLLELYTKLMRDG